MVRQYRIDRFNGMEILVCECFSKHLLTQVEHDAMVRYNEDHLDDPVVPEDFRILVNEALSQNGVDQFVGLRFPIPVYDPLPCVILRGPVVENRIMSLQVEFTGTVLYPVVTDEVRRFFDFVDNLYWRDFISHQIDCYGSLFGSDND